MDENNVKEIGNEEGLKTKAKNTAVEAWPMKLKKDATQEEFNLLLTSAHNGSERY